MDMRCFRLAAAIIPNQSFKWSYVTVLVTTSADHRYTLGIEVLECRSHEGSHFGQVYWWRVAVHGPLSASCLVGIDLLTIGLRWSSKEGTGGASRSEQTA